jgi:Zn-dependent protease with chaperone function
MHRLKNPLTLAGLLSLAVLGLALAMTGEIAPQSAPPPSAPSTQAGASSVVKGYSLPPEKYRQAVAYSRAWYRLYFIDVLWGLLILLGILEGRLGPRFRDWAEGARGRQRPRRRVVQATIYTTLLALTYSGLRLPVRIYGHWLSLKNEQSIEGWGAWSWDWTKARIITIVAGTFLVWILYGVIRRSPRRWWFYFWLASIPIVVFSAFIEPVVIEPLFYKFEPLAETQAALTSEIGKVVERAGLSIPPNRMFEMKASEKLKSVNAYMTGIGSTKRVVVWDTTISKMTIPETLSVFGHEMGHYVLGHVWKGISLSIGGLFVLLYLGFRGTHWAIRRWGARWAIRGVDDWASLPVLAFVVLLLGFLSDPISSGISRYFEHQADVYGLEVIHGLVPDSQQVTVRSFEIMGEVDLDDPDPSPFVKFWLYDHPPLDDRIKFALSYDPWSKGEQPQFVK